MANLFGIIQTKAILKPFVEHTKYYLSVCVFDSWNVIRIEGSIDEPQD